jgi:hypothetical protein
MIVMAVIGGIIGAILAVAGWMDYRARRRGTRIRLTGKEAYQNRVDADLRANPMLRPGSEDLGHPRKRDPRL